MFTMSSLSTDSNDILRTTSCLKAVKRAHIHISLLETGSIRSGKLLSCDITV